MRILIAGYPQSGKTTLAAELARKHDIATVLHTDDLVKDFKWGDDSQFIVDRWFPMKGPLIVEGMSAIRALRKWHAQKCTPRSVALPCDKLIYLSNPYLALNKQQAAMGKGADKVLGDIMGWVRPILERR